MPPSMTVDIKIAFPQTDMTPGPAARKWRRDLLQHGGSKSDLRGFTYTDAYRRVDGGVPGTLQSAGISSPINQ